jgi:DNA-binding GntR family transcriptional regulator
MATPARDREELLVGIGPIVVEMIHRDEVRASAVLAERLAVMPGDRLFCSTSRYLAADGPVQLLTSWRPVNASARYPADHLHERVIVRPADPAEIDGLALPNRGSVIAVESTRSGQRGPIDTADLILRSDCFELSYDLPLT